MSVLIKDDEIELYYGPRKLSDVLKTERSSSWLAKGFKKHNEVDVPEPERWQENRKKAKEKGHFYHHKDDLSIKVHE